MKPLVLALSLALAVLAFPLASAAPELPVPEKPLQCTSSGGDSDCRGELGPCWIHTHTYDVEDALNQYEVSCFDCGVHFGAGGVQCEPLDRLIADASASAALDLPFETHCWAMEDGSGCTTTFDLGAAICNYTSGNWGGTQQAWLECSTLTTGSCFIGLLPVQDPPVFWCENYGPGDDGSASAGIAPPALPCQTGIAGTDCAVGALDCSAHVGYRTGSASYQYARTYCGPELWSPCEHLYADTTGEVRSCLLQAIATPAAAEFPPQPCINGFAQTWCDFTVGPCFVRVTPWTAWGDRYVVVDCQGGGAGPTCHTEVHTLPPDHEHWCAFAAAPLSTAAPPPCQTGFGSSWCTVSAGPCRAVVTTFTAWGDRWATLDCAVAGAACHAEAHTTGPATGHSCAPAEEASAASQPCVFGPPHAGFDCTVAGRHCEVRIWLDLNPPNPTFDCPV